MKKNLQILITSASLLIASVCAAQPTLTESGMTIVAGEHFEEQITNFLSPGNAGPNQTWDLSALVVDTTITYSAVAPNSTPYVSSFPNETVAILGDSDCSYYKFSSSAWQNDGVVESNTVVVTYSNPEDLVMYQKR